MFDPGQGSLQHIPSIRGVRLYLGLAFGISWGAFGIRQLVAIPSLDYPLTLVMKYGPSLAGVVAAAIVLGGPGLLDLFRRLAKWRVAPWWYGLALLGPIGVFVVAIGIYTVAGGDGIETWAFQFPESLVSLGTLFLIRFFAGGGLGEELGWRGFMLPAMQARHGPIHASLIIGLWHGFWHLPAYGIAGTVLLTVFTTAMAVVATWMYNGTGGSVLLVALMHAAFNAYIKWIETVAPGLDGRAGWVLLTFVVAVIVAYLVARLMEPRGNDSVAEVS